MPSTATRRRTANKGSLRGSRRRQDRWRSKRRRDAAQTAGARTQSPARAFWNWPVSAYLRAKPIKVHAASMASIAFRLGGTISPRFTAPASVLPVHCRSISGRRPARTALSRRRRLGTPKSMAKISYSGYRFLRRSFTRRSGSISGSRFRRRQRIEKTYPLVTEFRLAWEQPQLFAEEMRAAFKSLRSYKRKERRAYREHVARYSQTKTG